MVERKLTTHDALEFLNAVKYIFQDKRDIYDRFLEFMRDFKAQRLATDGVVLRVKELFKGKTSCFWVSIIFCQKGYEITLEDDQTLENGIDCDEAISFINKIMKIFEYDRHAYDSFLDVLRKYKNEYKSTSEVYMNEVAILFRDHQDLLVEFDRFLPHYIRI